MKKLLAAMTAATILCCAAVGLTACGAKACEHNYEEDVTKRVEATCHSDGTKYLVCTVCGDETTEAITERPAHVFTGAWQVVTGGHARKCANCTAVDGNVSGHNYQEDTAKRVEATCHSDGEKTLICSECHNQTTEAITNRPAHDFDNGEWVSVDDENDAKRCASEGCNEVNYATEMHNMDVDMDKTDIPATCHSDGINYLKCTKCGKEKTEPDTNRPAHNYGVDEEIVWVEIDETYHAKKCINDDCGAIDENKVAHTWDEGTVTVQPAFNKAGEKTFTCDDCGATKTEEAAALTTADFKTEFTVENQDGAWSYGKTVEPWNDDLRAFEACTEKTADAWTADGVEIKAGWMSADANTTIGYTAAVATSAHIKIEFKGGQENTLLSIRAYKIVDNKMVEFKFYKDKNGEGKEVLEFDYDFAAGETIYIMFNREGDGFPNGDLDITLTVKENEG